MRCPGVETLPNSDQSQNSQSRKFVVQYHVRGRRKRQPLTSRCETVQEIIEVGQRSFPAFAERNPWICIDSKHATVFVGLDPQSRNANTNVENASGNVSLSQESIQR